ncbi:MAG: diaminopimelate epimerase [Gammaproteobacteria bacterium RIFCSPLOWO2_02_FULL_42_14]|nr:MAG: diaminopimelate epimerase [Gammaproteobacteria bacterium RIFCSPHIGHO2_02_FULL_42_43]OGT28717.1 MAG: diaminopimelate epimerase [Gammaproteobacteria bacterium RIFCSPHIGHO2_01_FULL_42_8]OGT53161.1 MAG: diaminopimelate epimerase [Gammaproteobacteria bacterium RIFCSPHIGHO2_12_FULL_41_25]OGT60990.1 MAG: diaminopimelate epimerase [Gammaproteobacteria bacterium RIFCSPLOWO2_02_FULL_42_14]OGT85306.1 MAG: diaminopimelate epimerase [Gammaproteobacteria bacterium RIFCSPLOWO2_12_FULL_42_18]
MTILFTKMQALGNDFVVMNTLSQSVSTHPAFMRYLADRRTGVGCDQVLLITKPWSDRADFGYRIFNADGSEVYQCGNGARCIALLIHEEKISSKKSLVLETKKALLKTQYHSRDAIEVNMGKPDFNFESLPFLEKKFEEKSLPFFLVSVGNPHCVFVADIIQETALTKMGETLNQHPAFPEGVNVGFMKIHSSDTVDLCVYERGAGLTKACGSGATAAVAIGQRQKLLGDAVTVCQTGGNLCVALSAEDASLITTGPASMIFQGTIADF